MPQAEQASSNQQDGNSTAQVARSTNARHQKHSMVELLHARISEAKQYPYIARRQRREGVATVGFVLHPDGSIEDAHLVASSRASSLDRAALSAVHRIEPFKPAITYLDRPEAFKVDVVFDLL
jgi:protein TonB